MARKRKGDKVDGWINFDKPLGMTSTQAVGKIRRFYNAQKVGHAGTLDPLATGILPIALGEATKTIPYTQDAIKIYAFSVKWGEQRSTDDAEGEVIASNDVRPTRAAIEAALPAFIGEIEQVPPQFSAVKIDGQRAYDLARDGQSVEIKSRIVHIESLELLDVHDDVADFRMICGKGTYVRSIARDLALDLGTYGYVSALRREAVGRFTQDEAISLAILEEMHDKGGLSEVLLPVESALDDILALSVSEKEAALLRSGQVLSFVSKADFHRIETMQGEALAVCNAKAIALVDIAKAQVKPVRVFNL
jgi:tRNA pseudouridine55 synthase